MWLRFSTAGKQRREENIKWDETGEKRDFFHQRLSAENESVQLFCSSAILKAYILRLRLLPLTVCIYGHPNVASSQNEATLKGSKGHSAQSGAVRFFDEPSSLLFYVITSSALEGFFSFYVLALTRWDRSVSQRLQLHPVIIQSSSDRPPLCLRVRSYAINLPRGSNSDFTLSHLFHRVCPSTCLPFILVSYDILYWHLLGVLSQGVASFLHRGTSKSFWNIIL